MFNTCKRFDQMSETAVRLMLRYPWFMGLYYSMRIYECTDWPPGCPHTLATNGTSVWVDPGFWGQLNRDQKMTAVAHEMGHKMLLHPSRLGERNRYLWNIAGDHVINHMLVESGFAPLENMTINGQPWTWFCDPKYKGWTSEAVYDDIMDEANKQCKAETGLTLDELGKRMLGAAADLVAFGENPEGDADKEGGGAEGPGETIQQFEQRVRKELKEAEQMSKIAGNIPAWMKRTIDSADHVKVNWYDVLEQYMKALSIADYSWARFNRREFVKTGVLCPDMWQPAMGGVKVFIDCSGSVTAPVIGKFNKHVSDVFEQTKPAWVDISYFETAVHHQNDHRVERGEFEVVLQPIGGGGTSFQWLADELDNMEEKPEVCLFLTDMYGPFGREPENVPVIWLSVSAVSQAPFGEVININ